MSDYQGSQAFAQKGQGITESVTRNSGSVNFSKNIVQLAGVRSAVDFSLVVNYAFGVQGVYGLPANWSFGIPYLIPVGTNRSITFQGKTFVIDFNWHDATGYYSGMKYVNNKGMKLENPGPTPLPDGSGGQYAWRLKVTDGTMYYYDVHGRIVLQQDVFGNGISYKYSDVNGPSATHIDFIQDSWGQVIKFNYGFGSITITPPDNYSTKISFSPQGISQIQEPTQLTTNFENHAWGDNQGVFILSSVTYPTKLKTIFIYTKLGFYNEDHSLGSVPAVSTYQHRDSQDRWLSNIVYSYGKATGGNTYTGAQQKYTMGPSGDGLVNSGNTRYLYDVCTQIMDESGKMFSKLRTTHNYLHVPLSEEKYLVDRDGNWSESMQTIYTYDISSNQHAQAPTYTSPVSTEQVHLTYDDNHNVTQTTRFRRLDTKFDDYGLAALEEEYLWNNTTNTYDLQSQTKKEYVVNDTLKIEMPASEYFHDAITDEETMITFGLNDEKTQILQTNVTYRDKATSTSFLPWKTKDFTYDDCGRVLSECLSWSDGAYFPDETVKSSTTTYSYEYNDGILTSTVTDALDHANITYRDMRAPHGPVIKSVMPMGQFDQSEYDEGGRLIKYTDRAGNARTISYIMGADENSIQSTDAMGFVLKKLFDPLGRVLESWDNGDPTSPSNIPNRQTTTVSYDLTGNVTTRTDIIGLETIIGPYDAYGRPQQMSDAFDNVTTFEYDSVKNITRTFINGDPRDFVQTDIFGRAIRKEKYPDSGDKSLDYFISTVQEYNSVGKVLRSTTSQVNTSTGSTNQLTQSLYTYNAEYGVVYEKTLGTVLDSTQSNPDIVERTYKLDLFGNAYNVEKTTTYNGSQTYVHAGAIRIFDATNHLTTYRNQKQQEEKYCYDDNGYLKTLTRFDETQTSYTYTDDGKLWTTTNTDSTVENTYLANTNLHTITRGHDTIEYTYTLAGYALSSKMPDGSQQQYTLDKFGRVVEERDATGVVRKTYYDNKGLVSSRTCGSDTIDYQYGVVNHTNARLVGETLTGGKSFSRAFEFDGFDRTSQITVLDDLKQTILNTAMTYNARGRLNSSTSSTQLPAVARDLNYTRIVKYDGLDQLISDVYKYTQKNPSETTFTYDGNSNVLSVFSSDNGGKRMFSYNEIDQRTDSGFVYDTNGRMTQDDKLRKYEYTIDDKLLLVSGAESDPSGFTYGSDNALSTYSTGDQEAKFFYDTSQVNAIKITGGDKDESTSFLQSSSQRLAGYDSAGTQTYFMQSEGSTSMLLQDGGDATTLSYTSFGDVQNKAPVRLQDRFLWKQELTDPDHGLVYLRSRFYSSENFSFLTMDSTDKENRYAYCSGDPLNLLDPYGHDEAGAQAAGIAVGFAVGAAITAFFGMFFPPTCIVASMLVGVAAGVAGNFAGDAVASKMQGTKINWAVDLVSGAVSGFLDGAFSSLGENLANKIANGETTKLGRFGVFIAKKPIRGFVFGGVGGAVAAAAGTLAASAVGGSMSAQTWAVNLCCGFGFGSLPEPSLTEIRTAQGAGGKFKAFWGVERARVGGDAGQGEGAAANGRGGGGQGEAGQAQQAGNQGVHEVVNPGTQPDPLEVGAVQRERAGVPAPYRNPVWERGLTWTPLVRFRSLAMNRAYNSSSNSGSGTQSSNLQAPTVSGGPSLDPAKVVPFTQGQGIAQEWSGHIFASYAYSAPFKLS